ncbi:MAG: metallophosphoesterase [Oscillospiraceae bacterium]|nr:metallophosphoesterase [Oscillospiraceae bacterium]
MKIVVMSDSHGRRGAIDEIISRTRGTAGMYIHLGDGEQELRSVMEDNPDLDIRHVAGNCDWDSSSPRASIIKVSGVRIFATHGHWYGVSGGLERLCSNAVENGCQIALYGHTHCRYNRIEGGIYVLNPGSCALPRDGFKPSFGTIDITSQGIVTNITDL